MLTLLTLLIRKLARKFTYWRKSLEWPILGIPENMIKHNEALGLLKDQSEVRINMLTLLTLRRANFHIITQTAPLVQQVAHLRIRTPYKVTQRPSLGMLTLSVLLYS